MSSVAPQHIAVVLDGNGRWAKKRLLPRAAGHRAGVKRVRELVENCAKQEGIDYLTVFAFSSENWRRPEKEVSLLMDLLLSSLHKEAKSLHKNNIRFVAIGDRQGLPEKIQQKIEEVETLTQHNTRLQLNVALNYGGRWDIAQAARALAQQVAAGQLQPDDVDEQHFNQYLVTAGMPDVSLFIRTSGEIRISNFLLWQLSYAELYFTDVLWPDFDESSLQAALEWFAKRQRRFGKTGEQVTP